MKKIFLTLTIGLLILSCSPNNDEPNYSLEILPIAKVVMPTDFAIDSVTTIPLKYIRPSACHEYYGLYYDKNDFTRTVAIKNLKVIQDNCNSLNDSVSVDLNFKPKTLGTYHFKFWKGEDAAGVDQFTEFDAVVNH